MVVRGVVVRTNDVAREKIPNFCLSPVSRDEARVPGPILVATPLWPIGSVVKALPRATQTADWKAYLIMITPRTGRQTQPEISAVGALGDEAQTSVMNRHAGLLVQRFTKLNVDTGSIAASLIFIYRSKAVRHYF